MLIRYLPYRWLRRQYIRSGAEFGQAVSYAFMGECLFFDEMLADWEALESEYSRRGYRTVSLEEFVEYGGYGVPLPAVDVRREVGEAPVLHAQLYRNQIGG